MTFNSLKNETTFYFNEKEAHLHTAIYYYTILEDYDNALFSVSKALSIDNKYKEAHYHMGVIYKLRKEYDDAVNSL